MTETSSVTLLYMPTTSPKSIQRSICQHPGPLLPKLLISPSVLPNSYTQHHSAVAHQPDTSTPHFTNSRSGRNPPSNSPRAWVSRAAAGVSGPVTTCTEEQAERISYLVGWCGNNMMRSLVPT